MHLNPIVVNLIIGFFTGIAIFTIAYCVIKYKQHKRLNNANNS